MEAARRTERIELRVTPLELAGIDERALAAGKKRSDYIRDRALCIPVSSVSATPQHAGQTSVDDQLLAAEIAESAMVDDVARDHFLERRTKQLVGAGRTTPVARREAEAEWESRGA